MKKTVLFSIFLITIMIASLSAQTLFDEPKPKEPIVLSVSSLEIIGYDNFKFADAKAVSQTIATVFGGFISNLKSKKIKVVSRTSFNAITEENRTTYSYDFDEKTGAEQGKLLSANYVLEGKLVVLTKGTVIYTAQIINVKTGEIAASINSGYKSVKEVEALLGLIDLMSVELIDNFENYIRMNNL